MRRCPRSRLSRWSCRPGERGLRRRRCRRSPRRPSSGVAIPLVVGFRSPLAGNLLNIACLWETPSAYCHRGVRRRRPVAVVAWLPSSSQQFVNDLRGRDANALAVWHCGRPLLPKTARYSSSRRSPPVSPMGSRKQEMPGATPEGSAASRRENGGLPGRTSRRKPSTRSSGTDHCVGCTDETVVLQADEGGMGLVDPLSFSERRWHTNSALRTRGSKG